MGVCPDEAADGARCLVVDSDATSPVASENLSFASVMFSLLPLCPDALSIAQLLAFGFVIRKGPPSGGPVED